MTMLKHLCNEPLQLPAERKIAWYLVLKDFKGSTKTSYDNARRLWNTIQSTQTAPKLLSHNPPLKTAFKAW